MALGIWLNVAPSSQSAVNVATCMLMMTHVNAHSSVLRARNMRTLWSAPHVPAEWLLRILSKNAKQTHGRTTKNRVYLGPTSYVGTATLHIQSTRQGASTCVVLDNNAVNQAILAQLKSLCLEMQQLREENPCLKEECAALRQGPPSSQTSQLAPSAGTLKQSTTQKSRPKKFLASEPQQERKRTPSPRWREDKTYTHLR